MRGFWVVARLVLDFVYRKGCTLSPLRRWGIASRHKPASERRASCLTATADPAVAAPLARLGYMSVVFKIEKIGIRKYGIVYNDNTLLIVSKPVRVTT